MSDMFPGDYATAETGVFWDIEQCEVPVGELNAGEVVAKISSNLSSFGHHFPSEGIKLNHFPAGHMYARQTKILEDIVSWSAEHPEPCTLMLIVGDTSHDFVEVVGLLKSMKNYQVHLISPSDIDDPIDQSGGSFSQGVEDNNNMRKRKKRRRCRGSSSSLGVANKLKKWKRCRIKKSKSPKVKAGGLGGSEAVAKPKGDKCSVRKGFVS
ncbi:PREDICTED: uncharacterized protein LOC104789838 [Camelina sativa]|uniref:Uncharacterized protein LOC104789838 n=1 Tax=Camelina sativa TaxID=90675 RepID=A0ABM0ZCF6_CAMSA|nr:PREDICTED: uncharacterized protein LOC104789838 [Camelina sativa]